MARNPVDNERKLCHFVATRLNTRHSQLLNLEPGWLDRRLLLFEQVCVPSVMAQTCQLFSWLVFADLDTPDEYKARIEAACRAAGATLVYCGDRFTAEDVRTAISLTTWLDEKYRVSALVTTQLDSDDFVAPWFVDEVHTAASSLERRPATVNFLVGYERSLEAPDQYWLLRRPVNEFRSYVERFHWPEGPTTVYGFPDHEASLHGEIVDFETQVLWCKLHHDENCLHRERLSTTAALRVPPCFEFAFPGRESPSRAA